MNRIPLAMAIEQVGTYFKYHKDDMLVYWQIILAKLKERRKTVRTRRLAQQRKDEMAACAECQHLDIISGKCRYCRVTSPPLTKGVFMERYKCDACGNAVCWVYPREDWGLPTRGCLYDVGVPVNWRKIRRQCTTASCRKGQRPHAKRTSA